MQESSYIDKTTLGSMWSRMVYIDPNDDSNVQRFFSHSHTHQISMFDGYNNFDTHG